MRYSAMLYGILTKKKCSGELLSQIRKMGYSHVENLHRFEM